jgi:hypothetical protein
MNDQQIEALYGYQRILKDKYALLQMPCHRGAVWFKKQKSPVEAWRNCQRGSWMWWALVYAPRDAGLMPDKNQALYVASECRTIGREWIDRLLDPAIVPQGAMLRLVAITRGWVEGDANVRTLLTKQYIELPDPTGPSDLDMRRLLTAHEIGLAYVRLNAQYDLMQAKDTLLQGDRTPISDPAYTDNMAVQDSMATVLELVNLGDRIQTMAESLPWPNGVVTPVQAALYNGRKTVDRWLALYLRRTMKEPDFSRLQVAAPGQANIQIEAPRLLTP